MTLESSSQVRISRSLDQGEGHRSNKCLCVASLCSQADAELHIRCDAHNDVLVGGGAGRAAV